MNVEHLFPLTEDERERIIKDLVQHKYECLVSESVDMEAELSAFRDYIEGNSEEREEPLTDEELVEMWNHRVGGWICSRSDSMAEAEELGMDATEFVAHQLELRIDEDTPNLALAYGFL